ncbi:Heterokaryon incompatibility protein 6-OR allele [Apiospora rasikravindrae]|uniref:Heterokaryon incompatibility protein 6-OR allele n=1 Tax=Apiospora rasikravindrae TaxID=990691 RepID=A0ABR1RS40_9PEZI
MLRELRDGEVDFALWVDALCINQQDAREKSIEIRRMRYIYSESHSVIVWLGFGSEDAVATVKLIEKVGMEDGPLHPDMSEESLPGWRGVCELARRPYWQRLWIIQEILSATPTAHMWFSGEWVEMRYFLVATSVLLVLNRARFAKLCQNTKISSPSLDHDGTLSHMKTLLFLQHYISKIEKNPYLGHVALLELLNFGAKAQQADPRDKIYGLLGLMDPRVQQEVEVDYNKPYPEVYRDFARMIVEKSGNLDIIFQQASNPSRIRQQDETELSGRTIDHDCPDLPSWTPNWLLCRTLDDHASGALGHNYAFFDAAHGTRHIPQQETNVNHLTCRGLLYASVDGLGCSHSASKHHDTHDVVAPISPVKVICHYIYRHWDRARDNMWAALTLGMIKVYDDPDRDALFRLPYFPDLIDRAETSGSPNPSWTYEGGPDDFRVLVQWQRCNRDFSLFGNPLPAYFEEASESFFQRPKEPPKDDHASLWDMRNILAQRRIATTTGGDLVLVPQGARQRDVIFILRGCNAPVVLRPRDDGTWYLVGECYIHAVMQGSIMKQYMEGHKDEDVVIR